MTGQGVRTIAVVQATAEGSTELSAFDAALRRAGIADQNLIYLSSIIPPGTTIVRRRPQFDESHFGNRLYCVMAERRTAKPGHHVWAGVGWVQDRGTGHGLFAEAAGETESEVRGLLEATLADMAEARPAHHWSPLEMAIEGATCDEHPVCAMVVGVYRSVPWDDGS